MTALTSKGSDTHTASPGRPARYGGVFAAVVVAALVGYAGVAMAASPAVSLKDEAVGVREERVALVIGNGRYEHLEGDRSAHKDALGVGAALERLGFTVTRLMDAGYVDMLWGLRKFAQAARSARAALVFYAGYGYAADGRGFLIGRNFLVPVDTMGAAFKAANEGDTHVTEGGLGWIPLEWVVRSVQAPTKFHSFRAAVEPRLRLVILDTEVQAPLGPTADTIVALAATGDMQAESGTGGDYSPYTEALLRYLEEPGIELGMLFRKVRDDVMRATEGRQEPAVYGLPGRGVYLGSMPSQPPASEPDLQDPAEEVTTR